MTKISDLEEAETELAKAQRDLSGFRKATIRQTAYISLLEDYRRHLIGDLDEVDTPNYHFVRENKHYDKPSNWKVSVVDKEAAFEELSGFDAGLIKHEVIERDSVDLKAVKQLIASGLINDQQFKSVVISKVQPKITVKAKVN
ncbi:hypothetical protein [Lactiplantibacillus pentosus]|jgi:hypothetical protein|uniref:hypothetical protein n=1 Tax=Lactiplantibacillus pentosus TaxID=1589 RepID=UPI0021A2C107|nr:hypothetical protein [Lactiplantibacillus pentosus]MCT3287003.1 hypothetical protein [Lactiplantibacillus pentosus]